jgi:hypothetical protein
MPYKVRLKTGLPGKRKKAQYKVVNASEYNQSLKKRGMLSLYFPKGDIRSNFINDHSYVDGLSGRQIFYKPAYIEVIYIFYRLLGWGMRQISGYFEDRWSEKGLEIPVPIFGHLSDLFSEISIETKQYCDKICKRIASGESINLVLDSSGMSFGKAGSWHEHKYGRRRCNRPWRKLHLAIDEEMNILGAAVSEDNVSDLSAVPDIMPDNVNIDNFIADGGYYEKELVENLSQLGITPVIPPPSHAVVQGKSDTTWHDKIVKYIEEKGIYAFHKKYGYGARAKVEAQFSRIKRCIGEALLTQKIESQNNEAIVISNIINKWNSFGRCNAVKVA